MAADWIHGRRISLTAEAEGNSVGHQDRAGHSSDKLVPQWMQQHCSCPRAGTGTGRNQLSAEQPTASPTLQWSTGAQAGPGEAESQVPGAGTQLTCPHRAACPSSDKTDSASPFHQKFSSLIKNQRKWVWSQFQPPQSSTCTQGQPPSAQNNEQELSWACPPTPVCCCPAPSWAVANTSSGPVAPHVVLQELQPSAGRGLCLRLQTHS